MKELNQNHTPRRDVGKSLDIIRAPKQKTVTPENVNDNSRERERGEFFEQHQAEKNDPMVFYLILGLCAIVLLVVLSVVLIYRGSRRNSPSSEAVTATTTDTATDTSATSQTDQTVTDTATAPAADTSTSTSQAAATPPAIDKANVQVRVVNGNGRNGEAALMAKALNDAGFTKVTTGNALSRYKTTVVYYKTGKLAEAQAVETVIKAKYKTSLLENPSIVKTNDVLVALGNE